MNSVDVKNALETIVTLNPGLSKDKLVVLLKAANWEEASIDQAVVIFSEMVEEAPALPHVDKDHLLPEGTGEAKKVEGQVTVERRKDSGVKISTERKITLPPPEYLPEGLPVKPFESSEHIITFSEYKEKFGENQTPEIDKAKIEESLVKKVKVPEPSIERKRRLDIHEPLSGADLSLVVVVSFLFLVIILLTGYMYSSGRLFR